MNPERYSGRLGDYIHPRAGFVYPEPGDEIVVLSDHETSATLAQDRWLRPGDVGTVTGLRKPGTFDEIQGYMGLVVHFNSISKSYPAGMVIFWDWASDPQKFAYRKAASAQMLQP